MAKPARSSTGGKATQKRAAASSPKSPAAKVGKVAKATKAAAAAKIPKVPTVKAIADHPTYLTMITEAINTVKDKKGVSRQAILKHILAHYNVAKGTASAEKKVRAQLNNAIKKGLTSGALFQASGTNGRFKLMKPAQKGPASSSKAPATPKSVTKKMAAAVASPSEKKAKSANKTAAKPSVKKSNKAPAKKSMKNDVVAAV